MINFKLIFFQRCDEFGSEGSDNAENIDNSVDDSDDDDANDEVHVWHDFRRIYMLLSTSGT